MAGDTGNASSGESCPPDRCSCGKLGSLFPCTGLQTWTGTEQVLYTLRTRFDPCFFLWVKSLLVAALLRFCFLPLYQKGTSATVSRIWIDLLAQVRREPHKQLICVRDHEEWQEAPCPPGSVPDHSLRRQVWCCPAARTRTPLQLPHHASPLCSTCRLFFLLVDYFLLLVPAAVEFACLSLLCVQS